MAALIVSQARAVRLALPVETAASPFLPIRAHVVGSWAAFQRGSLSLPAAWAPAMARLPTASRPIRARFPARRQYRSPELITRSVRRARRALTRSARRALPLARRVGLAGSRSTPRAV